MLRVLIVVNNPILGEAIEKLLSREDDLLVRRTIIGIDDDLGSAIDEFRPSVIIVEERVPGIELTGPDIAAPNSGTLRIITVSSEQNELEVVDYYRIPVLGLADLTTQVKGADRTV